MVWECQVHWRRDRSYSGYEESFKPFNATQTNRKIGLVDRILNFAYFARRK